MTSGVPPPRMVNLEFPPPPPYPPPHTQVRSLGRFASQASLLICLTTVRSAHLSPNDTSSGEGERGISESLSFYST